MDEKKENKLEGKRINFIRARGSSNGDPHVTLEYLELNAGVGEVVE
jgi:hypothetical protein